MYFSKHDEDGVLVYQFKNDKGELEEVEGECKCQIQYSSKFKKHLELVLLILGLVMALSSTVYTLYNLFHETEKASSGSHDL